LGDNVAFWQQPVGDRREEVEVPTVGWWSSDDSRRRAAFVAAVLVGTAVAGFGTGTLLGVASDGGTPVDATTTKTSSPPASPSSTATATKRAASEIERGTTSDIGYFLDSRVKNDGTHVTFDRALLLSGKAANDYAKAHHKKKPKGNGMLLVNDNPLTRDLVLAPDVTVQGAQLLAGSTTLQPVTLKTLLDTVAGQGAQLLLDLTYDDLGYVTKVKEHDLP
jgi:hypothetical protein